MTVYFSDLKDYGQEVNLELILNKYRLYFEGQFSVEHIIFAIHEHCKRSIEIPRVSNINNILNPEPPKITEAEFITAQKAQERNGYSEFSSEATLIKEYKSQNEEKKEHFKIENEQILKIAQNSIKLIEG